MGAVQTFGVTMYTTTRAARGWSFTEQGRTSADDVAFIASGVSGGHVIGGEVTTAQARGHRSSAAHQCNRSSVSV